MTVSVVGIPKIPLLSAGSSQSIGKIFAHIEGVSIDDVRRLIALMSLPVIDKNPSSRRLKYIWDILGIS